jgi:hypothetical protein
MIQGTEAGIKKNLQKYFTFKSIASHSQTMNHFLAVAGVVACNIIIRG